MQCRIWNDYVYVYVYVEEAAALLAELYMFLSSLMSADIAEAL